MWAIPSPTARAAAGRARGRARARARVAVAASLLAVLLPLGCVQGYGGRGTSGGDDDRAARTDSSGSTDNTDSTGSADGKDSTGSADGKGSTEEKARDATGDPADAEDNGSGTLLASNHPAWDRSVAEAMCFGNGVDRHSSDPEQAERVMAGRIQLGGHPEADLPDTPTWAENPFDDDNWEAAYHKLSWLDVLRREGTRTDDQRMLERWRTLLADWVRQNPYGSSESDWAWREVPTGQRTLVLTCAFAELGEQDWLTEAIRQHGEALTDPELRVDIGNHAMLQNNGLLAAGCLAGDEEWTRLAYDDNNRLLDRAVDEQGVTDEGSVDYQNNNYRWWHRAADRLDACDLPDWEHLDRLERMPELMAHATAPDGTYAMLGDTQLGAAKPVPGTVAEYAASQGESGPMPTELFRVFDRGYVFGRSGWGTERPFEQESYFTLRFGLPRSEQVHGHADHGSITFSSHGNRLLYDQGLYAFNGGAMRSYVRSPAGHNTVTVSGAAFDPEAPAELVAQEETSTHALYTVRVRAADSTVWTRTLFYSKHGRYLLIDDRVRLPGGAEKAEQRTAVQRFHLGSDREPVIGDNQIHTSGKGTDVGLFWLVNRPSLEVVTGQQEPLEGWRSEAYRQAEPAPVARAALTSTEPRFATVVAPLPGSRGPEAVEVQNVTVRSGSLDATVRIGDTVQWVQVRPDGATVTPPSWLYQVEPSDPANPANPVDAKPERPAARR